LKDRKLIDINLPFCLNALMLFLIAFIFISVVLLIWSVTVNNTRGIYFFKPLSTILIILLCLLSLTRPGVNVFYAMIIAAGLLFSLGGDIALMFTSERSFLTGLVLFLTAHILYSIGFTWFNGILRQDFIFVLPVLVIGSTAIYAFLYPGLGKMKIPVSFYVLVITFMVWRAVSTLFGTAFSPLQAILITDGAILFYLSDVILAFGEFKPPFYCAHTLNLLTYYAAQLLIALSASYF